MANTGQFNVCCSGTLHVDVHRGGLRGMFRRAVAADCVEFSVSGIRLETRSNFSVGEQLVIDLSMHDLRIEELPGVVRSATARADRNCYEIDFTTTGRQRGDALHGLRQIASHLRTHDSLAS